MKRIAAITMARNDDFFLNRWIEYYGKEIGKENLFVCLDGLDQKAPKNSKDTNIKKFEHLSNLSRAEADKHRINIISKLAKDLFEKGYDIVIGCDSDEFLVLDPKLNLSLKEYLSEKTNINSLSGLGLDVSQDLNKEYPINKKETFLKQRSFALLSTRYTKPVILFKALKWGSGFHCIKRHNFHIDKNLYLFPFGSVDYEMLRNQISDRNADWKKHLRRRAKSIFIVTNKKNRNEFNIKLARFLQTVLRPIYAWNKPAMFGLKLVTKIPERFKTIEL